MYSGFRPNSSISKREFGKAIDTMAAEVKNNFENLTDKICLEKNYCRLIS